VTPQFHVVFDEGFTSLTHLPTADHAKLMEQLFQKAAWMHPGKDSPDSEYYYYDSFWEDPPGPPPKSITRKKRPHPEAPSTHSDIPNQNPIIPTDYNTSPPVSGHEGATLINKTHPVSGHEGDPPNHFNLLPVSGITTKDLDSMQVLQTNMDTARQSNPDSIPPMAIPKPTSKIQNSIYKGSLSFQQSQAALDLACNVYQVHPPHNNESEPCDSNTDPLPTAPHIFATYIDLPVIYTESSLSAFLALNNKDDTLTQSKMLRTDDMDKFISSQIPEIQGLEAMGVFAYKNMDTLPPRARLLSSIWSYCRNGNLTANC